MPFTPHPITSEPEMRMRYLKQKQALYPDLWPLGKRWNDTLLPRQRGLVINGVNWDKDWMARSCLPWLPPLTDYKADNASAIKYTYTLCPMHTLNADQSLFGGTLRLSRQLFPRPSSFTLGGERPSLPCYLNSLLAHLMVCHSLAPAAAFAPLALVLLFRRNMQTPPLRGDLPPQTQTPP